MKYNTVIANPANNITVIVLDNVEKNQYIEISKNILKNSTYKSEQVGFVKQPINNGILRLEMMGGEFCGNALRSFGMMVARDNKIENGVVKVEISGSEKALDVEVDIINKIAKTEIPKPKGLEHFKIDNLDIFMVMFDGIYHAIVENMEASEENFEYIKNNIMKKYDFEALGVMFLDRENLFITPVVYVRKTDTLIFESSCGSGTVATVIYLSEFCEGNLFKCSIRQPGGVIDSEVYKCDGSIIKLKIGGKVELSEVVEIEI